MKLCATMAFLGQETINLKIIQNDKQKRKPKTPPYISLRNAKLKQQQKNKPLKLRKGLMDFVF